jgi:hypothetical protein
MMGDVLPVLEDGVRERPYLQGPSEMFGVGILWAVVASMIAITVVENLYER